MQNFLVLAVWAAFICCVVFGSLAPATSPVMVAVGRLHVSDKVLHFGAYLILAFLPVIGFRDRRRGIVAGLSMFALGVLLEAGQHFSVGRSVEAGDILANSAGIGCGVVIAFPLRMRVIYRPYGQETYRNPSTCRMSKLAKPFQSVLSRYFDGSST